MDGCLIEAGGGTTEARLLTEGVADEGRISIVEEGRSPTAELGRVPFAVSACIEVDERDGGLGLPEGIRTIQMKINVLSEENINTRTYTCTKSAVAGLAQLEGSQLCWVVVQLREVAHLRQ